jgi:IclR family transcriptional regulator, pca regulon regulatory protein
MPGSAKPASTDKAGPDKASTGQASTPDYRVEALAKGLRVLSVFSERRPTWRITDIATEVSLPLPTAYRIVMTLTSEGYLEHLPSGEYRPGVRVLTLGTAALRSLDLVELATPRLQELANATGETVNLAVLTGDQVLYLVRLRNSDLVTANIRVGSRLPAVHTSIGKLLLAFLDGAELERAITADSFAGNAGPNAKRSLDELRPELATIRAQGWAMQDEELAYGLRSVAAPVRGESGTVIAGANLALPSRDWPVQRVARELRPRVLETCSATRGTEAAGWSDWRNFPPRFSMRIRSGSMRRSRLARAPAAGRLSSW